MSSVEETTKDHDYVLSFRVSCNNLGQILIYWQKPNIYRQKNILQSISNQYKKYLIVFLTVKIPSRARNALLWWKRKLSFLYFFDLKNKKSHALL